MEENIKSRFVLFLKHLGIGQTKFESICGINRGTINNIKDGISSPNLNKIAIAYPELSMYWLITGKGEMLINNQVVGNIENSNAVGINVYGDNNNFPRICENIEFLKKQIERMQNQIEKQLAIIENLSNNGK